MATIFSKIVAGEIPSYKVAENDKFYAFLDINPLQKGHTLVIPKEEIDYFFDIPERDMQEMISFARKIAIAIKEAIPCKRIGVAVMGMEVPHAHIHLVPLQQETDMHFSKEKLKLSPEEFIEIAEKIKEKM